MQSIRDEYGYDVLKRLEQRKRKARAVAAGLSKAGVRAGAGGAGAGVGAGTENSKLSVFEEEARARLQRGAWCDLEAMQQRARLGAGTAHQKDRWSLKNCTIAASAPTVPCGFECLLSNDLIVQRKAIT